MRQSINERHHIQWKPITGVKIGDQNLDVLLSDDLDRVITHTGLTDSMTDFLTLYLES